MNIFRPSISLHYQRPCKTVRMFGKTKSTFWFNWTRRGKLMMLKSELMVESPGKFAHSIYLFWKVHSRTKRSSCETKVKFETTNCRILVKCHRWWGVLSGWNVLYPQPPRLPGVAFSPEYIVLSSPLKHNSSLLSLNFLQLIWTQSNSHNCGIWCWLI